MNKATYSILFSTVFWATSSFAGESLSSACDGNNDRILLLNVTIQNYNYNSINNRFNIRTSRSGTAWYGIQADNHAAMLYDIAKTARLTGESVDICVDTDGDHLLGLEWTIGAN